MSEPHGNAKLRIGVVIDCLHESYQSTIWGGMAEAARAQDVTLISFVATSQDRTSHFHVHYPVVRDFAAMADLDGLVVFTGSIAEHHGAAFAADFVSRFGNVPTVCMSTQVAGFPSVVVDNRAGIIELIDHFVQVHNLPDIAFLKGPAGHVEADDRLEAYREGMARNGLTVRDELIVDGDFSFECGERAVAHLLDRNIRFSVIIAADDKAAFGIIAELKRRKVHIPTEVAVAGFDDVAEAALSLPSLTTVRQPLPCMGAAAIEEVVRRARGETGTDCTRLPAVPVYRRSCGCFSDIIREARVQERRSTPLDKPALIERMVQAAAPHLKRSHRLFPGDDRVRSSLEDLYESLVWDVNKASIREIFLNEVDMLLFKFEEYADNVALLHGVLAQLANHLSSMFSDPAQIATAGAILQQAQALIREHRLNSAQTSYLQDTLFSLMIRETSQSIITTFEQRKLLQAISSSFPELNISSLVFAVYDREVGAEPLTTESWAFSEQSMLLLGYDRSRDIVIYPRGGSGFATRALFPPEMDNRERRADYIFMPLFFEDEHLGYAIFEYSPGIPLFMFEELRLHMSSALKSSFLMKELRVQSMLDDLTGLHNRRGFMMEGRKMFRHLKRHEQYIMVFYADMDDLKTINDTWGHEEGDVAIRGAASVLRQIFREQDIVARIGGDEFIAMLLCKKEMTGLEEVIRERLHRSLQRYNQTIVKPYPLSISIGVTSTLDDADKDMETLMREADERLMAEKRKKKRGRSLPPDNPVS